MTHSLSISLPADARRHAGFSAGIFVGLKQYEDPEIRPLPFAVDDAVDLAFLFVIELGLLEPSKTALLLAGEPAKTESKSRLDQLSARGCLRGHPWPHELYQYADRLGQATAEDGLLVAFFSTRGFDLGDQAVLAVGGTLKRKAAQTGLPLAMMLDELAKARARNRLILLDTCRESPEKVGIFPRETAEKLGEGFLRAIGSGTGSTVLTSTGRGGSSYEDERTSNGVFACALMDGLRGDAQSAEQPDVTVERLASYIHHHLRSWAAKKRPELDASTQGILAKFDPESMRNRPLSRPLRPSADLFEENVRSMLAHLLRQVGAKDQLFLAAVRALDGTPSHERAELLAEIRSFDGSHRSRRTLGAQLGKSFAEEPLPSSVPLGPAAPAGKALFASPPPPSMAKTPATPTRRSTDQFQETGTDSFGTWGLLRIGSAVQRLRWIEPGSFWMGSSTRKPFEEVLELPRHRVRLSQGFWFADTPCTQAFWKEIISQNPSLFKSSDRPFERLSWNRAQTFLQCLQARLPGIEVNLPTEAQWEYACRAGTETETYAGNLAILGERNAPLLDAIAWYGGNSGVDFDLDFGVDSTGWKEKQYPHVSAGTREVARKTPNAWGLYDMLGNVMEWCRDGNGPHGDFSGRERIDPLIESGSYRILRGGSWWHDARHARATHRSFFKPGGASGFMGFRIVLQ